MVLKSILIDVTLFQRFNATSITGCSTVACIDFNEDYKDKLFVNTTVDDFIFGGYKHGVIRWLIENKWAVFEEYMPTQITKENGFAVFNQKNDTAKNE